MKITYNKIMELNPCYDPAEIGMPADYESTIPQFIKEFRGKVKHLSDVNWLLLRKLFIPEKDLILFTIWCSRQVQHLMNECSIKLLDIAESYVYGLVTKYEFDAVAAAAYAAAAYAAAHADAADAADAAAYAAYAAHADAAAYAAAHADAADAAAYAAYAAAAYAAAHADAAHAAAYNNQIDKLLDYFETVERGETYDWRE